MYGFVQACRFSADPLFAHEHETGKKTQNKQDQVHLSRHVDDRVPTGTGKPEKMKFSGKVMESQGILKFGQKSWKSQGISL